MIFKTEPIRNITFERQYSQTIRNTIKIHNNQPNLKTHKQFAIQTAIFRTNQNPKHQSHKHKRMTSPIPKQITFEHKLHKQLTLKSPNPPTKITLKTNSVEKLHPQSQPQIHEVIHETSRLKKDSHSNGRIQTKSDSNAPNSQT